jgi:hypothetical protein
MLGAWLGDGGSDGCGITIGREDANGMIFSIEECGYRVTPHKDPIGYGILKLKAWTISFCQRY